MDLVTFFNGATETATFVMDIALAAFILAKFFAPDVYAKFRSVIERRALSFAFMLSAGAGIGALFYSNVIGYPACSLCLIQRVFMFPIPLVLAAALLKDAWTAIILRITFALSSLGVLVAAYHFVKDMLALYAPEVGKIGCPDIAGVPSCDRIYIIALGYITIPTIALTAFAWIAVISRIGMMKKK